MTNEELLKEAKRRYPKGTEYYCAHVQGKYKCTVSDPENFELSNAMQSIEESNRNIEKNGHDFVECIYYKGKWAEIVEPVAKSKPLTKEYKYKEGDEVSFKIYPDRKFIVRGYSENSKLYLISSEGFCGHDGIDHSITWGEPVKNKSNWWAEESKLSPWVEEESFQIGRWYQCKNTANLYVKLTGEKTGNVIWASGRYQEDYSGHLNDGILIKSWNLLDDLSIIQEFLPDGHPDKVVVEKTPEPKSLVGRYLKALVNYPNGTRYKKGDYIEIKEDDGSGSVACTNAMSFGYLKYDWSVGNVELMPEGFHPDDVEPTTPKLKVGQWVKIIDKPEGGRPKHWSPDGEMDEYFGQWIQVESLAEFLEGFAFSVQEDTEDDEHDHWYFKHSDYTEVRDSKPELMKSWLDEQQEECYRLQYQHALLMHERESLIRNSVPTYTRPLKPQECHKPCESKEDIVSSHLILLDVKPVRVSKQFK